MKPKKEAVPINNEQDLQTCFIIAGYTGAGKSTIVRTSHELDIPLFGNEYHQRFRDTSRSSSHEENDNYDEAIKTSANFQGKHIRKLAKEQHPPKNILIQLDLKHVVHRLGHSAATKKAQKKIEKLTKIPTPRSKKIRSNNLRHYDGKLPKKIHSSRDLNPSPLTPYSQISRPTTDNTHHAKHRKDQRLTSKIQTSRKQNKKHTLQCIRRGATICTFSTRNDSSSQWSTAMET